MYVCEPKDRIVVGCMVRPMQAWQNKNESFPNHSFRRASSSTPLNTSIRFGEEEHDFVGTTVDGIIGSVLFELEGRGTKEGCRVYTIDSPVSHIISSAVNNNMGLCCFVTRNGLS